MILFNDLTIPQRRNILLVGQGENTDHWIVYRSLKDMGLVGGYYNADDEWVEYLTDDGYATFCDGRVQVLEQVLRDCIAVCTLSVIYVGDFYENAVKKVKRNCGIAIQAEYFDRTPDTEAEWA